ncbi:hypothetical protein ACW9UR_24890 [Halovulum sp. GXIMD14794]
MRIPWDYVCVLSGSLGREEPVVVGAGSLAGETADQREIGMAVVGALVRRLRSRVR